MTDFAWTEPRVTRPWMPLYIADYLADTTHLRALESGAYLHLIMHYWQHGGLPGDDRKLSAIAKLTDREWVKSKPTLAEFFQNGWQHKRIDAELAKAADISSKRAASAKQKRSNSSANAEQLDTHARASSPSQRKEDAPTGATTINGKYAFESGVIRLNQRDLDNWKASFSHLDVPAELIGLTKWAGEQGANWFFAVQGALAKRNREVKAKPKEGEFVWKSGIEGVL